MTQWITVTAGELQWQVNPHWTDCLFDAHGLRLPEWNHQGLVEVVKEAWHRSIVRVRLPHGTIYVKHYPLADLRSHVRQLFRSSKARDELECTIEVAARQVPTIEPLAVGETPGGESFLVTRGLEQATPLNIFLDEALRPGGRSGSSQWRFRLTEELARFLAHMHEVGVVHPDLHAGNILVRLDETGRPRLHLIDLHAVELCKPLNWRDSRDNMVLLNRWFVQRSSRADRRRFWRTYFAHRRSWSVGRDELRERAKELERRTWESCLGFWNHRAKRCLGRNRYFNRLTAGGNQCWYVRDLPAEVVAPLTANPELLARAPGYRIIKQSRGSVVAESILRIGSEPRPVIFKRFDPHKRFGSWLNLVRKTPALRSWLNGFRLLVSGLPTARPLAVIHRRRLGLVTESYLLTEKLPEANDLHAQLDQLGPLPAPERRRQFAVMIDRFSRLVRLLHDLQLSHRDLKASNVLVRIPDGNEFRPEFWFIDLAGLRQHRRLPLRKKAKNLARLNVSLLKHPWISRTDRLRFLRGYQAWGLRGKKGWKELWRQVAKLTQDKLAANQARNRPIG